MLSKASLGTGLQEYIVDESPECYSFSLLESHVPDPGPETGGRGMDQVLGNKYVQLSLVNHN